MDYLLSQNEYDKLTDKKKSIEEIKKRDDALEWCRKQLRTEYCGNTYCDACKISSIGSSFNMEDKDYIRPSHDISDMVCKEKRRYSK